MAFNILPIELNKEIAYNIINDRDLCNFMLVCQETRNAVNGDNFSFWRTRFNQHFDMLEYTASNAEMKKMYQRRRETLKKGTVFKHGGRQKENRCVEVLKNLLLESYPFGKDTSLSGSKNVECIKTFVYSHTILNNLFRPTTARTHLKSRLFSAIQLCFAHWSFDLQLLPPTYGFPYSQFFVYSAAMRMPIFIGNPPLENINLEFILHIMNFFKYHMTQKSENTLYDAYSALSQAEQPGTWRFKPREGCYKLGQHWKGTYAYLDRDEIPRLRSSQVGASIFMDKNVEHGEGAIQSLKMTYPSPEEASPWPILFEQELKTHPERYTQVQRSSTRRVRSNLGKVRFDGSGYDEEPYNASGFISALPPQEGIPGWQRFTMMKYFEDSTGNFDESALWAYEGIVIPGGQMILGRWWSPDEGGIDSSDLYCGPFIFWNIDRYHETHGTGSEECFQE